MSLGPAVVDENVVQQIGIATRLEPDVGQLAAVSVTRCFVALQVDHVAIVVEGEGVGGIVPRPSRC